MFCNDCGAQIPDGSRFCNACGHQVGQGISVPVNKPHSRKIYLLVAIISLVAITSLGVWWAYNNGPLSGPPDKLIIEDFKDPNGTFTNIKVASKGRCPLISPDAQALGISEAWLIVMDYDRETHGNTRLVISWGKQHGNWRPLYDDTCP